MKKIKQAIGICGGTFDPVHIAHLRLAIEAKEQLSLSKIIWVPSGNPYHRNPPVASVDDRLSMLKMALADDSHSIIDTTDLYSEAPTYTVNTLKRIQKQYDIDTSLVLLLGSDAFLSLPSWHDWTSLFDFAHIVVATRLNYSLDTMSDKLQKQMDYRLCEKADLFNESAGRIVLLPMIECDISASLIREKAKKQLDLTYLVPSMVQHYIIKQAIYSKNN